MTLQNITEQDRTLHNIALITLITYILAYLHTYILTYLHTCILTYLHTYILTYLHTCILAYLHSYLYTYIIHHIFMLSNVHICQSMCQSVKTLIHLASSYLVLPILFYLPISLSTYIYIYTPYAHWISADHGANRLSAYGIWSNLGENRKLDRSRGSKDNHGFCGSMKALHHRQILEVGVPMEL